MMLKIERYPERIEDEDAALSGSPEVITSLISSLSAISTPVENHFNNLPAVEDGSGRTSSFTNREWSGPSSAGLRVGHSSNDTARNFSRPSGFGMDYGAYDSIVEEERGSIEDAAMPPVVRLAKPSTPPTPSSYTLPTPSPIALTFRRSQQSLRAPEEFVSIGRISTEVSVKASSASIASSTPSSRSKKFRKKISKDTLRVSDNSSNLRNGISSDQSGLNIFVRAAHAMRPTPSNRNLADTVTQEYSTWKDSYSIDDENYLTKTPSAIPQQVGPQETVSVSVSNGAVVPSRRSSLRHSVSGSPRVKQGYSGRKRHSSGSRDLKDLNIDPDLIEEDHQTVRRIRELQDAKEKREKELRKETRKAERSKSRGSSSGPGLSEQSILRQNSPRSNLISNSDIESSIVRPETSDATGSVPPTRTQPTRSATEPLRTTEGNAPKNGAVWAENGDAKSTSLQRSHSTKTSPLRHNRTFSYGSNRRDSVDSVEEGVVNYLRSPRLTQKVRHPITNRVIAFSEVGDPEGFVVFCCVGMGLTRYLTAFYDELARTLKLRLITPDRPGIGESEACHDGSGTPLGWSDDVTVICNHLRITKFSLLAHSAGALYALAAALRLPQQIRGRIHLMAPWIPPSQMTSIGNSQKEALPVTNVPYSQKILRILPASFLKAANSSFLTARSASATKQSSRSKASKRQSVGPGVLDVQYRNGAVQPVLGRVSASPTLGTSGHDQGHEMLSDDDLAHGIGVSAVQSNATSTAAHNAAIRQATYDELLTQSIWDLAIMNANPAIDLITCLERRQPIGFKYVDITRSVVIHHGTKDTRVPVENVKWLGKMMRRCEVRVLEGEGHGLMANASVMGAVLGEVAREWEDWLAVTQGKGERKRREREETL